MSKKRAVTLQPYPRDAGGQLLAAASLFPLLTPPMNDELINTAVDEAFRVEDY